MNRNAKVAILGIVATIIIVLAVSMNTNIFEQSKTTQNSIQNNTGTTSKIKVIASFYPLYEFARNVGGDKADVTSFIPNGVEPHDWDPSPDDIQKLTTAKIFVYNGAGMEVFVDKIVNSTEFLNLVTVEASKGLDLLTFGGNANITGEQPTALNPHVWLDPIYAKHEVSMIKDAFVKVDPSNAQYYENNANNYIVQLDTLDTKIRSGLSNCNQHTFVPFHSAFDYFAKRYSLTQMSVGGLVPEAEASPEKIKTLVDFMKANNIKVAYAEELVDPKLAQVLADEVGAQVLVLSPLEGLSKDDLARGATYLDKMSDNLQNLRVGLECK